MYLGCQKIPQLVKVQHSGSSSLFQKFQLSKIRMTLLEYTKTKDKLKKKRRKANCGGTTEIALVQKAFIESRRGLVLP